MRKGIILLGSSNSDGETRKIVSYVSDKTGYEVIDLKTKIINQFDYNFKNRDDDFHPLIEDITNNYELIIFATPVYWYSMSGIMKKFFDRISDCLKIEKETGRKLRQMEMAVISCAADKNLKNEFYMPFIETAKYLGMNYVSDVHTWVYDDKISEELIPKLDMFVSEIS